MYEVEWTPNVPLDDCGDADLDAAETKTKYFKRREEAFRFAQSVYPSDYFGAVRITECHREPCELGTGEMELVYDGESEFVDEPMAST